MQLVVNTLAELWLAIVVLHDVQTFVDGFLVFQRKHKPATQQAASHRRHGMVNDIQQRLAVVLHGCDELQRADGELIEAHIAFFLDTRDTRNMCYLRVQRLFQILQDGASGNDTTLQMVDAKAFQRLHVEVLIEFLVGCLLSKHPVVELEGHQTIAKITLKVVLTSTVVEHLLGLEVANKLFDVVVGTLARQEFTRRNVEERHTTRALAKVDSSQKVVLLVVQHRILHGHTWGHQFRDAALDQFLRQLRIFQLVADGHTLASPDELWQIGVQRMVREPRHLVALVVAVVTVGQRDAEYLRGNDGVLAIGLVEVAATKQQQRLRVLGLEVEKLFHHRGEFLRHVLSPVVFLLS